ncbi:short-chain dehydrogenase/reductase SDR [Mycena amicta]|nr:short-chain dehydrogenase/reductase SDR [Mycena amicta]
MPTAIVTGASSGIGRESAVALVKAGWNVVITARRADALAETKALCGGSDEQILVLPGDVTDEDFVKRLFEETKRFGRLDLLFNNAGVGAPATPLEDLSLETFQNVISVNLVGPFLCAREAVRVFKAQTPIGGRIVNNGSISAHTPRPLSAPYTASKHGITGLSKCISLDGRAFDITCTTLDIGNAATALTKRMEAGVLQPDGRYMPEATFDVAQVGAALVYLGGLPSDVSVPHFTIMAHKMPFAGRG